MANYLSNAFSLQMVREFPALLQTMEVDFHEVPPYAISCIGHEDTAAVVASILKRSDNLYNRANISIGVGDRLFVAQIVGGRLPEGATTLPEGFQIKFYKVFVMGAIPTSY